MSELETSAGDETNFLVDELSDEALDRVEEHANARISMICSGCQII